MNIIQRPIWRRFIEKCVRSTYPKSIKLIELELPDQAWKGNEISKSGVFGLVYGKIRCTNKIFRPVTSQIVNS